VTLFRSGMSCKEVVKKDIQDQGWSQSPRAMAGVRA
jgi:hypothetical protein